MNVGYVVHTHTVQTFSVCMEKEVSNTSRSEFEKNLKNKTGKQNYVFKCGSRGAAREAKSLRWSV